MTKSRHGMRRTRIYGIWSDMLKRCRNPNCVSYRYYGAKGISVCPEWASFTAFYSDMGDPPEGLTLDRIDSSLGYSASNCRWATPKEQAINRSSQVMYDHGGDSLTLPDLCLKVGIKYRTMLSRLKRTGMTVEAALAHQFGSITERGLNNMREAVTASNIRRGLK